MKARWMMIETSGKPFDESAQDMSITHRHELQAKMTGWAWGAIGVITLWVAIVLFVVVKVTVPTVAARGEWLPLGILAALWLWWLRGAIPQWLRARQDLAEGTVATMEGIIRYEIGNGIGLIPLMKYRLWVGAVRLEVTQPQLFALQSGKPYRVQYTPRSHIFLEATPLDVNAPMPSPNSPALLSVPHLPAGMELINEREQEILGLIAAGYANKEIARQLSLSVNTVKMYISQLYQKMGVNRRTEAVARAREWGLLP
jgi:DNA-binding CsgD family transcriptional regulator